MTHDSNDHDEDKSLLCVLSYHFFIFLPSQPTGAILDGKPLHRSAPTTGAKVGIYKNGRVEIIPNDQGQRSGWRLSRVQ